MRIFILLAASLPSLCQLPEELSPIRISPLYEGTQDIEIVTPLKKGSLSVTLNGEPLDSPLSINSGTATLLSKRLLQNQFLQVSFEYMSGGKTYTLKTSAVVKARSGAAPAPETPKPVSAPVSDLPALTVRSLRNGDSVVRGSIPLLDATIVVTAPNQPQKSASLKDGAFSIALDRPVFEGQVVDVRACFDAGCATKSSRQITVGDSRTLLKISPVNSGDKKVTFSVSKDSIPFSEQLDVFVSIFQANDKGEPGDLLARLDQQTCLAGAASCIVCLKDALKFDQIVQVNAVSGSLTFDDSSSTGSDPTKGILVEQPVESTTTITGSVPKNTASLEVLLYPGYAPGTRQSIGKKLDVTLDKDKATFTATSPSRLVEAQGISITPFDDKGKKLGALGLEVAPSGYDWGRVKAFFSVGTVIAQDQGKFSKAAPYVRFNMDYNFIPFRKAQPIVTTSARQNTSDPLNRQSFLQWAPASLKMKGEDVFAALASPRKSKSTMAANKQNDDPQCAPTDSADNAEKAKTLFEESLRLRRNWHYMISGYADAQLTQTPVAASTGATISSQTLQSSNSGYFEYGLYAPVAAPWTQWTFRNLDNALYIAPLVKFGFMTVGDNLSLGGIKPLVTPGAYKFYAGGLRIGHLAIKNDPGDAPENVSHADIAIGRYGVFRFPNPNDKSKILYPVRVDIRGNLKIPATPLFVGLAANLGAGPIDIRLMFGARVNLAKLFSNLIPTN